MLFDDKLSDIIRTLESDGVLLFSSDTVWSLACSLHSNRAIEQIFLLTKRKKIDPLTLLVNSLTMLKKHVPHIHPRIETLLHFHHKPLSVIYPDVQHIPTYAKGADNNFPIRIVHDPYCNQIIHLLGNPLVSTSANIYQKPFPNSFSEITESIIEGANFVSKHKRFNKKPSHPSVVIDYNQEGEINFLRH